jgi:hypothetical protein
VHKVTDFVVGRHVLFCLEGLYGLVVVIVTCIIFAKVSVNSKNGRPYELFLELEDVWRWSYPYSCTDAIQCGES